MLVSAYWFYYSKSNVHEVHPCFCTWQNCVLFHGWVLFFVYMYHFFFIHSSVNGHSGCFHILDMASCPAFQATLFEKTVFSSLHILVSFVVYCCFCLVTRFVCVYSVVSNSATPWNMTCQTPLPVEFFRQEYWSGLPYPSPGHLPNPGIEPEFLASPVVTGRFFTAEPPGKPI